MVAVPLTIETAVKLFLYGSLTPSDDLNSRIRSVHATSEFEVDAAAYVNYLGTTASPFMARIVKDFFFGRSKFVRFCGCGR